MDYYTMGWGALLIPFFWVAFIIFIVWMIKEMFTSKRKDDQSHALHILEDRFAKGEIDEKEFESRKKILKSSSG